MLILDDRSRFIYTTTSFLPCLDPCLDVGKDKPLRGELEGGGRTLLFIDQFEELFTQAPAADAQTFLDCLTALHGHPNLHILLTVRADFYPELMGCSLWSEIKANRLDLPPLGRAELAAANVQPAAQVGVSVDPLLVERLTADAAGEKGSLPLVQECLRLLWQGVARRYLPAAAYAGMAEGERNGLQIAIDRRASVVYNNLPANAQPIARRIFLRLIQFGEGRADTRRQVAEDDLRARDDDPAFFGGTLQTLIDRRLLTASGGEGESARRVDIAHEALIAGWALLRGWIDERRAAEQTRRRLEAAARRWEELARAGGLLDAVELAEAQRWLAQPDSREVGGASAGLAALIAASAARIRVDDEEKEAARQRELVQAAEVATISARRAAEQAQARRRTLLLAVALLTAVVVIGVVGWFWQQSRISEARALEARATIVAAKAEVERLSLGLRADQLSANGLKVLDENPPLALLLAVEGLRVQNDITRTYPVTRVTYDFARSTYVTTTQFVTGSEAVVGSALTNMHDLLGKVGGIPLPGHGDGILALAFSPDGRWLATGSLNSTAWLWTWRVDDLIDLACAVAGRNLSAEEWARYLGDQPYRRTCERWPNHPSVE